LESLSSLLFTFNQPSEPAISGRGVGAVGKVTGAAVWAVAEVTSALVMAATRNSRNAFIPGKA
jgi:hypothetical protein